MTAATGRRGVIASLVRVGVPTAAFLGVGLSGFVLLAAGPRLLPAASYAMLAVAWTVIQAIAVGVSAPTEQAVSQGVAAGSPPGLAVRLGRRLLGFISLVLVVPIAGRLGLDPVFDGDALWSWSVVLGAFGGALAAPSRGVLAGQRRFSAYGLAVATEAVARITLIGVAWLGIGPASVLLAASLWAPIYLSAVVGWLAARAQRPAPILDLTEPELAAGLQVADGVQASVAGQIGEIGDVGDPARHQGAFTVVAVATQVALGFGTVWLQALSPASGVAGQYVSVTTYMRIPITLVGGLLVVVLATTARAYAQGDQDGARRLVAKALLLATGVGVLGVAFLLAISGWALPIYYGQPITLGWATLVGLGLATVAAIVAGVVTQAAFACAISGLAALVWVVAAGAAVLGSVIAGTSTAGLAAAVVAGQALAAAGLGVRLVTRLQPRSATTSI